MSAEYKQCLLELETMIQAEVSFASVFGYYNKAKVGDLGRQNIKCQKIQREELTKKAFGISHISK